MVYIPSKANAHFTEKYILFHFYQGLLASDYIPPDLKQTITASDC